MRIALYISNMLQLDAPVLSDFGKRETARKGPGDGRQGWER